MCYYLFLFLTRNNRRIRLPTGDPPGAAVQVPLTNDPTKTAPSKCEVEPGVLGPSKKGSKVKDAGEVLTQTTN